MIWSDWDADRGGPSASKSHTNAPASKKARVVEEWDLEGMADQLFPSDSEAEGTREVMTSKIAKIPSSLEAGVDHDEGREEDEEDEEEVAIEPPRKRKATAISRTRSSVPRYDSRKKHNLRDMVEKGHGGRIMFVLEKVTESKMT